MNNQSYSHYYGDTLRILFVTGGLIMLISYPFFSSLIHAPLSLSILACLALVIFGGLINPKQKWVIFLSAIVPIVAFLFFEYYAVYTYQNLAPTIELHVAFFWTNQILALIFFFATYLSIKTLRGALLTNND